MSFYKKYLKYKTKYENLVRQIGGATWICPRCTMENEESSAKCAACDGPKAKTFYIYTTGIGEWGDLSKAASTWDLIMRDTILRNIDPSFNQIIIAHYDPLLGFDNKPMEAEKIIEISEGMEKTVVNSDKSASTPARQIDSSFRPDIIDFAKIKSPHLVVDLAHIFKYEPSLEHPKKISIGGHYMEPEDQRVSYTNINAVYPGYCGELQIENAFSNQIYLFCLEKKCGNSIQRKKRKYFWF